jgi:hypothetical protein
VLVRRLRRKRRRRRRRRRRIQKRHTAGQGEAPTNSKAVNPT